MTAPRLVDPGVGRAGAPVGSKEWAESVRLQMQSLVKDLPKKPESFWRYCDKVIETAAWEKMNKPDGSTFGSLIEFCAFRQPWGMGKPWDEIEAFLVPVAPKEKLVAARAAAVPALRPVGAPEGSKNNPRGAAGKQDESADRTNGSDATISSVGRGAEYKTAKVKRAALAGDEKAKEALAAAERGEVKSAAELERLAGLAKPPPTPAQKVARIVRKVETSQRVTIAVQAVESLSTDERERFFEACRTRGWIQ